MIGMHESARKFRFSIQHKFFIAIALIALIFVSVFSFLNIFCYSSYYNFQKLNTLRDIYKTISEKYTDDVSAVFDTLSAMENRYGVRITIQSTSGPESRAIYDTIWNGKKRTEHMPEPPADENKKTDVRRVPWGERLVYDKKELDKNGYTYSVINDPMLNVEFMSLIGNLKNGDRLVVRIPMAYLEETSHFTMTFLLIAGIFTFLVCMIFAYFISRRFSKPLIEMKNVANSMATLDFSKKYTGTATDEIGELGRSINQLSDYLEKAIGELRLMNRQLEEEISEKEKIDAMRKEFIINVSHELKTPIALVQGYSEGLRINLNSSEEDKNYYCDIIIDEAKRMNKLVMQLLTLSKIELGNVTPELCEVNMLSMTERVVNKTKLLADAKAVTIVLPESAVVTVCDYDMVEQIVTNYLTNAIDHTPSDGKIIISMEKDENNFTYTVFNDGDGIPEDEIPKIWEKFYKLDKARTRMAGGSGIGLSIVSAIIAAHNGTCGAENVEGGVRFYFTLPLSNPDDSCEE